MPALALVDFSEASLAKSADFRVDDASSGVNKLGELIDAALEYVLVDFIPGLLSDFLKFMNKKGQILKRKYPCEVLLLGVKILF